MNRAAVLVISLGLGLYGLKLANDAAQVAQSQAAELEGEDPAEQGGIADVLATLNTFNPVQFAQAQFDWNDVSQATLSLNVRAFLAMIRKAEGTDMRADPYRVCYAYRHTIVSMLDHPAVTGEWRGESLASLGPKYAGKISTAAGAYQIIRPTWLRVKAALRLPDFSPASQDAAAVYLIKGRGALADVEAGNIARAIELCRDEWASLPGGDSGQPQRRLAELLRAYTNSGGYLA